ncbi:MAG: (2Fe-2S)-binding protein [Nitrososphaerota archaeon]
MPRISFRVNGVHVITETRGRDRLIDLLRRMGLMSVKEGCSSGDCGSCNVIVNGELVNSCLMLAVQARGCDILTLEGLGTEDRPHKLQLAFVDFAASQCGYCIPGIIMTAKYLLDKKLHPSDEEIRRMLTANICRCGGYTRIVDAIKSAVGSKL